MVLSEINKRGGHPRPLCSPKGAVGIVAAVQESKLGSPRVAMRRALQSKLPCGDTDMLFGFSQPEGMVPPSISLSSNDSDVSDHSAAGKIPLTNESCPMSPTLPCDPVIVEPAAAVETTAVVVAETATDAVETNANGVDEVTASEDADATSKASSKAKPSSTNMRVWEYDEDQMLLAAVQKLGKRWRAISRLFPDRSEAMCRNRFTRIYAPHRPEMKGWKPSVNRCNACGQYKKGHSCSAKNKLFCGNDQEKKDSDPLLNVADDRAQQSLLAPNQSLNPMDVMSRRQANQAVSGMTPPMSPNIPSAMAQPMTNFMNAQPGRSQFTPMMPQGMQNQNARPYQGFSSMGQLPRPINQSMQQQYMGQNSRMHSNSQAMQHSMPHETISRSAPPLLPQQQQMQQQRSQQMQQQMQQQMRQQQPMQHQQMQQQMQMQQQQMQQQRSQQQMQQQMQQQRSQPQMHNSFQNSRPQPLSIPSSRSSMSMQPLQSPTSTSQLLSSSRGMPPAHMSQPLSLPSMHETDLMSSQSGQQSLMSSQPMFHPVSHNSHDSAGDQGAMQNSYAPNDQRIPLAELLAQMGDESAY